MLPTGTVTFLFTDIEGSTPLWEREPEKMAAALQVHNAALRQAIEAHDGVAFKTVGDEFQVAFPTAPQALSSAIQAQRLLQEASWNELGPLKVRMGLHTGEAELDPGGDEYAVSHTKNRTARIMSAAHGGQVLLSAETRELVDHQLPSGVTLKDLGEHHLKGLLYPEHLHQVVVPGLRAEFPPLRSESRPSHNLPLELTSFIGRQREIAQVQALLREQRLVTLTGSGGVGKTRLSIQAAGGMLVEFPDGVWYVELAPISDPELLPQTVAAALGLREERNRPIMDTLAYFLGQRELLLVLDNCEHLLEACARLADALLRKAPRLRMLSSSREALGIAGEHPFHVPSLAIADPRQLPSLEALQACEAVQLFIARALVVLPAFEVDEHNARTVAQICQRLDGIPLAIELAAARLNMLTTEQLASRLDNAFRLLTGGSRTALPRQQTLRATIDWSHQLLSDPERILLRRLAVFAGGGTLEGIEDVCADDELEAEQILDLLSGLVSKSMVGAERRQQEETRYRLLETVRQYAREKLFDASESEVLRKRHLDYYVALCEAAFPHIHGARRIEWTRRLRREHDNLREALEWAFHDPTLAVEGLRIATALTDRFWATSGFHQEASRWLTAGIQAAGDGMPKLMKAKVLSGLILPEGISEKEAIEQCTALVRKIGPQADRELCLVLARNNFDVQNYEETLHQVAQGVEIARTLGPEGVWELGETLFYYAMKLSVHPEGVYDDQALAAAEESVMVLQKGDRWNASGYLTIGIMQNLRGQHEQARRSFEMALELFSEVDDYIGLKYSSFELAWHHRLAGHYGLAHHYCQGLYNTVDAVADEDGYALFVYSTGMLLVNSLNDPLSEWSDTAGQVAVRLLAATRSFLDKKWPWYSRSKPTDLRELERLRHRLGEEVFVRAWIEGQAMTLEQAVALALEVYVE
jgi:predicted ATPase/class 3 adenylate cyclase